MAHDIAGTGGMAMLNLEGHSYVISYFRAAMSRIDRFTNGVVIASVTGTVVIILVVFITTERHVFLHHRSPRVTDLPPDVALVQPWVLIDRQTYLSHNIIASGSKHTKRLPRNLVPEHYDLEIQPLIDDTTKNQDVFKGKVTIHISCTAGACVFFPMPVTLNPEYPKKRLG